MTGYRPFGSTHATGHDADRPETNEIETLVGLFTRPDEGISQEHAERMAAMPTHDEFVEALPDGLPDDDGR